MKATVYVVATYHRWGDELHAFGTRDEAEACVMEYAREFWDGKALGHFPRSYERLYDVWTEHDLWGSVESRWELEKFEVDLPAGSEGRQDAPAAPTRPTRRQKRARSIAPERKDVLDTPRIRSAREVS